MREDGVKTYADIGYGSYNTLQTEATNRIRKGRFTSVVSGSYNRTDGHRADMGSSSTAVMPSWAMRFRRRGTCGPTSM